MDLLELYKKAKEFSKYVEGCKVPAKITYNIFKGDRHVGGCGGYTEAHALYSWLYTWNFSPLSAPEYRLVPGTKEDVKPPAPWLNMTNLEIIDKAVNHFSKEIIKGTVIIDQVIPVLKVIDDRIRSLAAVAEWQYTIPSRDEIEEAKCRASSQVVALQWLRKELYGEELDIQLNDRTSKFNDISIAEVGAPAVS